MYNKFIFYNALFGHVEMCVVMVYYNQCYLGEPI